MKETVNIGYIGLGRRGSSVLQHCLCYMDDVNLLYYHDRLERQTPDCHGIYAGRKVHRH